MIEIVIRCDGCDVAGDSSNGPHPKAHILRESLKRSGWVVGQPGAKDYCPQCKDTVK